MRPFFQDTIYDMDITSHHELLSFLSRGRKAFLHRDQAFLCLHHPNGQRKLIPIATSIIQRAERFIDITGMVITVKKEFAA